MDLPMPAFAGARDGVPERFMAARKTVPRQSRSPPMSPSKASLGSAPTSRYSDTQLVSGNIAGTARMAARSPPHAHGRFQPDSPSIDAIYKTGSVPIPRSWSPGLGQGLAHGSQAQAHKYPLSAVSTPSVTARSKLANQELASSSSPPPVTSKELEDTTADAATIQAMQNAYEVQVIQTSLCEMQVAWATTETELLEERQRLHERTRLLESEFSEERLSLQERIGQLEQQQCALEEDHHMIVNENSNLVHQCSSQAEEHEALHHRIRMFEGEYRLLKDENSNLVRESNEQGRKQDQQLMQKLSLSWQREEELQAQLREAASTSSAVVSRRVAEAEAAVTSHKMEQILEEAQREYHAAEKTAKQALESSTARVTLEREMEAMRSEVQVEQAASARQRGADLARIEELERICAQTNSQLDQACANARAEHANRSESLELRRLLAEAVASEESALHCTTRQQFHISELQEELIAVANSASVDRQNYNKLRLEWDDVRDGHSALMSNADEKEQQLSSSLWHTEERLQEASEENAELKMQLLQETSEKRLLQSLKYVAPHTRGVTMGQLLDFFEAHCGEVMYLNDDQKFPVCMATKLMRLCNSENKKLTDVSCSDDPARLEPDLLAVEKLLIRSLTRERATSYSELVNPCGLECKYFMSYNARQNFAEFVQGLYRCAIDMVSKPGLTATELVSQARAQSFWVSCFSINCWSSEADVISPLEDMLFCRTLAASSTKYVVLNLDESASAISRAWPLFELHLAHSMGKEVVMNTPHGPVGHAGAKTQQLTDIWAVSAAEVLRSLDIGTAAVNKDSSNKVIQEQVASYRAVNDRAGSSQGCSALASAGGAASVNETLKALLAQDLLPNLVRSGSVAAVKWALQSGADVNACDQHGLAPLKYSVVHHGMDSEISRLLLNSRAIPLTQDDPDKEQTPKKSVGKWTALDITQTQRDVGDLDVLHSAGDVVEKRLNSPAAKASFDDVKNPGGRLGASDASQVPGLPELGAMLDDKFAGVRWAAARALGDFGPGAVQLAPDLALRLVDDARDVRLAAREALEKLGYAIAKCGANSGSTALEAALVTVMPCFIEMLQDKEPDIRKAAAQALALLGSISVHAALQLFVALSDEAWEVRRYAAEAFGNLFQETAADPLPELDASHLMRALPGLVNAVLDPHPQVRDAAAQSLSRFRASGLLSEIGAAAAPAVPLLVKNIASDSPDLRVAVVQVLGTLGVVAAIAVPDLVRCLDDAEWRVQVAAAEALASLGVAAMPAVDEMRKRLGNAKAEVNIALTQALEKLQVH